MRAISPALHRLQDGRGRRGELKGIAVAARHDRGAAAPLLGRDGSGQEIVGLVAGRLGIGEAAGRDELRQDRQLLDDLVVELAPALIGRERLVPVGRRIERVPADQHRARLLGVVEPQQEIGEADDRAGRPVAVRADRFRNTRDRRGARRNRRR